jgi:hypothetical protein
VVGETSNVVPIAPVDQVTLPVQLFAVNVKLSPIQILVFPAVTVGAFGLGITVMVISLKPIQLVPVLHAAV